MPANWSLILNVLLLIGVVIAIGRLMKSRRRNFTPASYQPLGQPEIKHFDDIIAVRKVNQNVEADMPSGEEIIVKTPVQDKFTAMPIEVEENREPLHHAEKTQSVMMFLLAKENRQLAGYELLQTVLASGLRFGEGNLFHRHQYANGQGPVLCSLAAATASGVFDLQNIGAFSVRGLCLFMQSSGNPAIDAERLTIMYETAKLLSDGLDTYVLDEQKQPLSEFSLARYRDLLNIRG